MQRLKSKKGFERLRQCTQKVVGKYFILVYLFDESIIAPCVGLTVSKKVGNAVVRNKVKRRLRSCLHEIDKKCNSMTTSQPPLPSSTLCNIIALPSVVNLNWMKFKSEIETLLEKICLYYRNLPC